MKVVEKHFQMQFSSITLTVFLVQIGNARETNILAHLEMHTWNKMIKPKFCIQLSPSMRRNLPRADHV